MLDCLLFANGLVLTVVCSSASLFVDSCSVDCSVGNKFNVVVGVLMLSEAFLPLSDACDKSLEGIVVEVKLLPLGVTEGG